MNRLTAAAAPSCSPAPPAQERYPLASDQLPPDITGRGAYHLRFARSREQLDQILALRFKVFNLELNEGLLESYATGRDEDELDHRFHHLMICHHGSGEVVGTYRMQTPEMASRFGGYYTAGEFDLSKVPQAIMARAIEIGRACVSREHRNGRVLHALWRGLAAYLTWNRKTALFGCCSLTSQDPALGVATLQHLETLGCLESRFRVEPLPALGCEVEAGAPLPAAHIPALFQSYLNLGARVCGPAAIDRRFRTIDFLVLLDVLELEPRACQSFFE